MDIPDLFKVPSKKSSNWDDTDIELYAGVRKRSRKFQSDRDQATDSVQSAHSKSLSSRRPQKTRKSKQKETISIIGDVTWVPERLRPSSLHADAFVLGRVERIAIQSARDSDSFDGYLEVHLPNGIRGCAPLSHLSSSVALILRSDDSENTNKSKIYDQISSLYPYGQLLQFRVLKSISETSKASKKRQNLVLSADPRDVNNYIKVEHLRPGALLQGSVSAVEEHGYLIDLGIASISHVFLHSDDVSAPPDAPLAVGTPLWCTPKQAPTPDHRTLRVCALEDQLFNQTSDSEPTFEQITPGTRLECEVETVLESGFKARSIRGGFECFVHRSHLPRCTSSSSPVSQLYHSGDSVRLVVLVVEPLSRLLIASALPHLVQQRPSRLHAAPALTRLRQLARGTLVEADAARVTAVERGGLYAALHYACASTAPAPIATGERGADEADTEAEAGNKTSTAKTQRHQFTAWIPRTHFPDRGASDKEGPQFIVGEKIKCRITGSCLMDNLVIASMKESVVESEFMSVSDIPVATLQTVRCEKLLSSGDLIVRISANISGLIPRAHLSDADLSHPERHFAPGTNIRARVLSIDLARNRVRLTHKPSLLSDEYPPAVDYSTLKPGRLLRGYVASIVRHVKDKGAAEASVQEQGAIKGFVLEFFAHVHGFVPAHECPTDTEPEQVRLGQALDAVVLAVDPDKQRLLLSLKVKERSAQFERRLLHDDIWKKRAEPNQRKIKSKSDVEKHREKNKILKFNKRLSVHDCGTVKTVIFCRELPGGSFMVKISRSFRGLIPHLQVDRSLAKPKRGDLLTCKVLSVDVKARRAMLTQQSALVHSEHPPVTSLKRLSAGQLVQGYVAAVGPAGIAIRFYNHVRGFVARAHVPAAASAEGASAGEPALGQVLLARVLHVDPKRKALRLSLFLHPTDEPTTHVKKRRHSSSISHTEINVSATSSSLAAPPLEIKRERTSASFSQAPTLPSPLSAVAHIPFSKLLAEQEEFTPLKEEPTSEPDAAEFATSPWLSSAFATALPSSSALASAMDTDTDLQAARDAEGGEGDAFAANERAVLERPNESAQWLAYVAALVQRGRLAAARALVERALNTIHFREEKERFNIWCCYLNLELQFGSEQSLKEVFDRALQMNEPFKILRHMALIYSKAGKYDDAAEMYARMQRKYGHTNAEVWLEYALFCYRDAKPPRVAEARTSLDRALTTLPKSNHVALIAKYAEFEFKLGELERGVTLFEALVSANPKRLDLWFVYIDMCAKKAQLQRAREIFERLIASAERGDSKGGNKRAALSAHQLRSVLNKYVLFEQAHGGLLADQHVQQLRLRATELLSKIGLKTE